jgi:hypothetical protein
MMPAMTPDETFADELEGWLRGDGVKTLGSLGEVFRDKAFATTILVLMFLPALPLPTGGITHVFEAIAVVVAAQMVLGRRTMWLPRRWQARELGALTTEKAVPFMVRWVRRLERFSRPRGAALYDHGWFRRLLGVLLMALAIAAAIAPPFSGLDTLPAMGAVVVALSIILEDVVILAIGTVIGGGGTAIILTLGAAVVRAVRDLL